MAGVGEASAVVGLIATAAQLSKAILGIAFKYKDAKKQIKGLGDEVASFGEVLDQMHHLLGRDHRLDHDVRSVLASIVNRSGELLSEIKVYKNSLCSRKGSVRNHSFRGRIKWGFEATKLEYLRARVQSQKADMLLMMNIHYVNNLDGPQSHQAMEENDQMIHLLELQCDALAERLERLQDELANAAREDGTLAIDRLSVLTTDITMAARLMRVTIMSLYRHQSYYQNNLGPCEEGFDIAPETLVDHSSSSMITEDHLHPNHLTRSTDSPPPREGNANVRELAAGQSSRSNVDEVMEAEATETLQTKVVMRKGYGRSTPSEALDTPTVSTRPSNDIQLAYPPEFTNEASESTPATLTTTPGQPLVSLPSTLSKTKHQKKVTLIVPLRTIHLLQALVADEARNFSHKKHKFLRIKDSGGPWWEAKNQLGERGLVANNYILSWRQHDA